MKFVADSGATDISGNALDTDSWRVCWSCSSADECNKIDVLNGTGGSSYFSDTNDTDESNGISCVYESWNKKYTCTVE
jgi:hypothetical protein